MTTQPNTVHLSKRAVRKQKLNQLAPLGTDPLYPNVEEYRQRCTTLESRNNELLDMVWGLKQKLNAKEKYIKYLELKHQVEVSGFEERLKVQEKAVEGVLTKDEQLLAYSRNGNESDVQSRLSSGEEVTVRDDTGKTALHHTAQKGHVALCEKLLDKGADVNVADAGDRTPLHVACREGHLAVMELLVGCGASVNARDKDHLTPLHHAAQQGHVAVCEKLLDKGADVNGLDTTATEQGHTTGCDQVMDDGAGVNVADDGCITPFDLACCKGHLAVLELLVVRGARDKDNVNPLHHEAQRSHVALCEQLLDLGAEFKLSHTYSYKAWSYRRCTEVYPHVTPLHLASGKGHLPVVQLLVSRGAPVDVGDRDYYTALHHAAEQGHVAVVEHLLNSGVNARVKGCVGYTPLHFACVHGHLPVVELLVARGASIAAKYHSHIATLLNGHTELRELLLSKGSDVNITPLHVARNQEHLPVVTLLVSRGASVNACDIRQSTPLHVAAVHGHVEVCEYLLNQGANIDALDNTRCTPLQMACSQGKLPVVKLLVTRGASFSVVDKWGGKYRLGTSNQSIREYLESLNPRPEICFY